MNMDRKTIIAVVLTIVGFSAYNYYLQSKYPNYFSGRMAQSIQEDMTPDQRSELSKVTSPPSGNSDQKLADNPKAEEVNKVASPSFEALSQQDLVVDTPNRRFVFDQNTSSILSVKLKKYKNDQGSDEVVELLDSPLVVQGSLDPLNRKILRGFEGKREGQTLIFSKNQGQFAVEQRITVPQEGYGLDISVSFTNISSSRASLDSVAQVFQTLEIPQSSGGFGPSSFMAQNKSFIFGRDGGRDEEIAKQFCEDADKNSVFEDPLSQESLDFIGFDMHYFLAVVSSSEKLNFDISRREPASGSPLCPVVLTAYQKQGLVDPNQTVTLSFKGYFGPKDVELLAKEDPKFTNTVRFGWFSIIAKPLLTAVKATYSVVHNYGIAIILVTILLKILFFPLTKAAAVSMKKMQKLNPEMTKIREKYKDDPQKQQKELMMFMSKHKVNPAKGCLPILPQIPVFIAFYNVLSQAIELRHAPFFGWIGDLASADPYYVTPILLGLGMFVQQKLTPNPSMDKNQEKIMLMMPVIFTVMMLSLPAGMVLYMIANTAVSIVQQQWLNSRLDKQLA